MDTQAPNPDQLPSYPQNHPAPTTTPETQRAEWDSQLEDIIELTDEDFEELDD